MQSIRQYLSANALLLLATLAAGGYLAWQNRHFQLDDALIYQRYLRNLFEGNGLTYNAGERFNGLTSPLFSYLLILANLLAGNLQHATIFLSSVFLCGAAITGAQLVGTGRYEQTLCALAVVSFNYFYTTFGMETSLFLFLTALALMLYRERAFFWLGVVLGLLFITRGEGALLGVVLLAAWFAETKRMPPLRYFVAPVVLIAANFIFNRYYYGAFFPATGSAKIGQGQSGFWGQGFIFLDVQYMRAAFLGGSFKMLAFMAPIGLIGLAASLGRKGVWQSVAYLILLGAFYVFLNIPNYHWYYAPFYFFWLWCVGAGVWTVLRFTYAYSRRHRAFAAVFVAFLVATAGFAYRSFDISNVRRGPMEAYRDIGVWLNDHTAPEAKVATVEIGTIGWYSHRYIIDILGLTNRYNADYIAHKDVYAWLSKYSPDYILVHQPLNGFEVSATCLVDSQAYAAVPAFQFTGYRLLKKSDANGTQQRIEVCATGPRHA
jgi:arabinofuranosyltransferase